MHDRLTLSPSEANFDVDEVEIGGRCRVDEHGSTLSIMKPKGPASRDSLNLANGCLSHASRRVALDDALTGVY